MRASLGWKILPIAALGIATGCSLGRGVGRNDVGENKKRQSERCSNVKIEIKGENIGDLYYANLLEKMLTREISLRGNEQDGDGRAEINYPDCVLSVNTRKVYRDSVIGGDGTVFGRNVRVYVNYNLTAEEKLLKKNSFT
ncbi:MAG: hypothetical protein LBB09_00180, partial [Rickettsiales bacterium]|nr:hypothetical protein [Rickettsiales bacterium]